MLEDTFFVQLSQAEACNFTREEWRTFTQSPAECFALGMEASKISGEDSSVFNLKDTFFPQLLVKLWWRRQASLQVRGPEHFSWKIPLKRQKETLLAR